MIRRPIALAVVLDALPVACIQDQVLCGRVRRYLDQFTDKVAVTQVQAGLATSAGDSTRTIPNAHGLTVKDSWTLKAGAYYQPSDYLLVNAGVVAHQDRSTPTGSMVSAGISFAQLDVGFRDHWFSPLADSSLLISTEAPTMPSVTLSNYEPISRLGINYEVFLARMSKQEGIRYFGGTTAGNPLLAGIQAGIAPADGYALSINRVMQYGGGARNQSGISDLVDALFINSNRPDTVGQSSEFGNQVASISSSMVFPGKTPFAVRIEYGGEDNAYAGSYRLGANALSLGIDFPRLWQDYDLAYEVSEWQNVWYVHHIYPQGLTNHGAVIGHWFGDERQFGDAFGGRSHALKVGWRRSSGDYLRATYRTLSYDPSWRGSAAPAVYTTLQELGIDYSTAWHDRGVDVGLFIGRDVFDEKFARIAASVDLAGAYAVGRVSGYSVGDAKGATTYFLDLGANRSSVNNILATTIEDFTTGPQSDYHLGLGARREVTARSDLGARIELDQVDGRQLLSLRMLDYRFRFNNKLALTGFVGAGRYDVELPAFGYYWGAGVQYLSVFRDWDLNLDVRHHEKLGRDKVLATDPPSSPERTRMFFDVNGIAFYLSRNFH